MAVPSVEEILYPFLSLLKDNPMSVKDVRTALKNHFKLTDEDCSITTRSGKITQFKDRVGWVRQWLRRAKFIEIPKIGIYKITQRGLDYLSSHTTLSQDDLLQYPEYAAYATGSEKVDPVVPPSGTPDKVKTPTERLEAAWGEIEDNLAADILQHTLEVTPERFEHIVLDLMLAMGYGDPYSATVTRLSHDDGVDGIIPQDKLGFDKIYIQAKRYAAGNTVQKPELQKFSGALEEKKAVKGVFITTSSFSSGARDYVRNISKKIILIDGPQLARLMIDYNIGVAVQKTYYIKSVNTDYFVDE